jgi:hypothetical protein
VLPLLAELGEVDRHQNQMWRCHPFHGFQHW